jgi:hypothetical protein
LGIEKENLIRLLFGPGKKLELIFVEGGIGDAEGGIEGDEGMCRKNCGFKSSRMICPAVYSECRL